MNRKRKNFACASEILVFNDGVGNTEGDEVSQSLEQMLKKVLRM